tara:strand:- start:401 stop:529 length:129 start_codon:yes stop_codon:yes gene_type:complete
MKKLLILFCLPMLFTTCKKEDIEGCTDFLADNYDADADDGSC